MVTHSGHPSAEGQAQDGQLAGRRPAFCQLCYATNFSQMEFSSEGWKSLASALPSTSHVRPDSERHRHLTVEESGGGLVCDGHRHFCQNYVRALPLKCASDGAAVCCCGCMRSTWWTAVMVHHMMCVVTSLPSFKRQLKIFLFTKSFPSV